MSDFLAYRIPGEEVKSIRGAFIALTSLQDFEGFVVSNFEGTKIYGFVVDDLGSEIDFTENKSIPFVISQEEYLTKASTFLSEIKGRKIDKAIYSRVKKAKMDSDSNVLFTRLCDRYSSTFCYEIRSEELGNWVGASPEKLIQLDGTSGSTIALASTKRVDDNSKWGDKELMEQDLVTQFIEEILKSSTTSFQKSERTEVIAGPVKHLATHFNFECSKENVGQLLKNLHPTPAVSGFPREIALALIQESESHDREIYAGMIGVISQNSTRLFVNLRCCKIVDSVAYLFLGGGFTKDSNPLDEWNETENKATTILDVLT